MMNRSSTVFFDLSAAQPLKGGVHGGGEYARAVLERLVESGYSCRMLMLVDSTREVTPELNKLIVRGDLECLQYSSREELQELISSGRAATFYSALPYEYSTLDFTGLGVIFTVHGLRPIEMPTDKYEALYAGNVIGKVKCLTKQLFTSVYRKRHIALFQGLAETTAKHTTIVVPSEHSKSAVQEILDLPANTRLEVLYSPATSVARGDSGDASVLEQFDLRRRRYLLLVSGSRWVKNAYRALIAIKKLQEKGNYQQDLDIVVTGGLPRRMRNLDVRNLHVLPYVSDSQLKGLYANAFALLYPTLNEGFGYPPLEAMASGTPVLSSDTCSLPEISGEAPLYFSATDIDQIMDRIAALTSDDQLWQRMHAAGLRRVGEVLNRQDRDLDTLVGLIMGETR